MQIIRLDIENFSKREKCPFCSSSQTLFYSKTYSPRFKFPIGIVELTSKVKKERRLMKCYECGILYHHLVPKREVVTHLNQVGAFSNRWSFDFTRDYGQKLNLIRKFNVGKRILDVGCHLGEFLSLFEREYELWGVDPLVFNKQDEKSLKFLSEYIEDVNLPLNYFSAITMFDVIEHIYDIKKSLTKIFESLDKNGILIIETGDCSSIPARVFRGYWWYYSPIEHLTFLNGLSLGKALTSIGFDVMLCMSTIHHKLSLKKQYIELGKSIPYLFASLSNCLNLLQKICRKMGKFCSPPQPQYSDHFILVAKKH